MDPALQFCSSDPASLPRRRLYRPRRSLHLGTPHDFPYLNYPEWFPGSDSHGNNEPIVSLTSLPPEGAHFCSTGTSFGNDTDLATCSVSRPPLPSNSPKRPCPWATCT
jgi:hypothetical protein